MKLIQKNGLSFWQSDLFKGIAHGSFTKEGGYSAGPYQSLNVSFEVGDDETSVSKNRNKIEETLQLSKLMDAKQVHGNESFVCRGEAVPACDALLTNTPGIPLLIKHADCQAALFYDPKQKVIAAVHAGWQGNVKRIYTKIIERLTTEFGTDPKDLLVCISPSLGPSESSLKISKKSFRPTFSRLRKSRCTLISGASQKQSCSLQGYRRRTSI